MIKNTAGSYCVIKDIKISGLYAYITLLIYSSVPQENSRVFLFYLKDEGSEDLHLLSNTRYWIDRHNNYDNDSLNIDIEMYREIILQIDITKENKSQMLDKKWLRNCQIVLVDETESSEIAWQSETIELISKEIELPEIKQFKIRKTNTGTLNISFMFDYETQKDFNYANRNLSTVILVKSAYTNTLIETIEVNNPRDEQTITVETLNNYTEPVYIELVLRNLKEEVLLLKKNFFNQLDGSSNLSIKGFGPVINSSIKDISISNIINIENK